MNGVVERQANCVVVTACSRVCGGQPWLPPGCCPAAARASARYWAARHRRRALQYCRARVPNRLGTRCWPNTKHHACTHTVNSERSSIAAAACLLSPMTKNPPQAAAPTVPLPASAPRPSARAQPAASTLRPGTRLPSASASVYTAASSAIAPSSSAAAAIAGSARRRRDGANSASARAQPGAAGLRPATAQHTALSLRSRQARVRALRRLMRARAPRAPRLEGAMAWAVGRTNHAQQLACWC